jgi:hypothetical protein
MYAILYVVSHFSTVYWVWSVPGYYLYTAFLYWVNYLERSRSMIALCAAS